jgi:rhamnulokinase
MAQAGQLLLIPDLLTYWLTGEVRGEVTNASTTGLFDIASQTWSPETAAAAGLDPRLLPPLVHPGEVIGGISPDVAAETGLDPGTVVTAVGSHDTASAVVAVPAAGRRFGYVSCGTWSLVGVELDQPVLSEDSRAANFTNEGGVDGRVRYLRNVMGLWLLQESLRVWQRQGTDADLPHLLRAAAELPDGGPVVDPDEPRFLPSGDMPERIRSLCVETGQRPPAEPAEVVRCILDSLAAAYARAVADAVRLSGQEVDVLHLVGGGARNSLLCRLTAEACGVPVLAGPVEATALGNVLVQARAYGALSGDLEQLRSVLSTSLELQRFEPGGPATAAGGVR